MSDLPTKRRYYKRRDCGPLTSLTIVLRLTVQERAALRDAAKARGFGVTGFARLLIEKVLQDDLIGAVLDD